MTCEPKKAPRWLVTDKAFYKLLLALALPIGLQNLVTFTVNFAVFPTARFLSAGCVITAVSTVSTAALE